MIGNAVRALCALSMGLSLTGSLAAQEAVLAEFYGSGVHQFFAGNMAGAIADLSQAVNGGSKDPRVFYFRALAEMRSGNVAQAQTDLQRGATLESADLNQFYPVAKSLERVQGRDRLTLERFRTIARAEAFQHQQQRNAVRYEQRRRAEGQVLRAPDKGLGPAPARAPEPVAPAAATTPEKPAPADALPAAEENLFEEAPAADDAGAAKADDGAMPAEDAPAAGDENPFADEK